jgi:hypothetical protein
MRALAREIERADVPRVDRQIPICHPFATPADQWRVWCADSLLWAFEEWSNGDALHAFRGLLQAKEYIGRLGFAPGTLSDAYSVLRNLMEDVIRKAGGQ